MKTKFEHFISEHLKSSPIFSLFVFADIKIIFVDVSIVKGERNQNKNTLMKISKENNYYEK